MTTQAEATYRRWGNRSKDRQASVLWAVESLTKQQGYPPSIREVASFCDMPSTDTAKYWLNVLRERGMVSWEDGKARTIRVVRDAQ